MLPHLLEPVSRTLAGSSRFCYANEMSAVDSPADVLLDETWDDLTPGQIAARNPSSAQVANRFQPGVSGNPAGSSARSREIGLATRFHKLMLEEGEDGKIRLDAAAERYADAVAELHPVWFKEFLAREWPAISKMQAEVLTASVRNDVVLVPSDKERDAEVAYIMAGAARDVIDVGGDE